MFAAYFDESFDKSPNGPVYVIAGYIGEVATCLQLSWDWERKLKEFDLPYFKASDCEFGFGEFAKFRNDPRDVTAPLSQQEKDRLREVKTAFVDLARQSAIVAIGVGVLIAHFDDALRTLPYASKCLGKDPYYLCYQTMLMESGFVAGAVNKKWRTSHVLAPMFDNHEEYSGHALEMYNRFRELNPQSCKWLVDGLEFGDDQDYKVLQASDNLAFEVRKMIGNLKYSTGRRERVAWTRLKENAYRVYCFDFPTLKRIVEGQTPINESKFYDSAILADYEY